MREALVHKRSQSQKASFENHPVNRELLPKPGRAKLHVLPACSQQRLHLAEGEHPVRAANRSSHSLSLEGARGGEGEEGEGKMGKLIRVEVSVKKLTGT